MNDDLKTIVIEKLNLLWSYIYQYAPFLLEKYKSNIEQYTQEQPYTEVIILVVSIFLSYHLLKWGVKNLYTLITVVIQVVLVKPVRFIYTVLKVAVVYVFIEPIKYVGKTIGGISMKESLGIVEIPKNKRGLVYQKLGKKTHKIVSIDQEAGYQAEMLEEGRHFGYWKWKYEIELIDPIEIKQDEIALVMANEGAKNMTNIALGKIVECNDFQDGKMFLQNGGEKGRQLAILTEGIYFINPKLFTIYTSMNIPNGDKLYGLLKKHTVPINKVAIVNILIGQEAEFHEILKIDKEIHNSYQNPQAFFDVGGCRGLQDQLLTSGEYSINPWFAELKQVDLVDVPSGTVGVVISDKGRIPQEGEEIVDGMKGVWSQALREGRYPLNTEYKHCFLLPTNEIILYWKSSKDKDKNNYDIDLDPIEVGTKDGYNIALEISQTIWIREEDAPKLILKMSAHESTQNIQGDQKHGKYPAVRNLISRIIKPMVESHFKSIAHNYKAIEFRNSQGDIRISAHEQIKSTLNSYGVSVKPLTMTLIKFPESIDQELREIEQEERKRSRLKEQRETEKVAQEHERADQEHKNALDKLQAESRKKVAKTDTEIFEMTEKAKIEVELKRTEILIKKEEEFIRIYGKEVYLELQKYIEFAKIQLPQYGGEAIGLALMQHYFDPQTKKFVTGSSNDFLKILGQFIEENNLQIAMRSEATDKKTYK
jgi:hypothetical protein